ncbi:MAG: GIY-YIG nuclease family protein [Nitrospirota bacterium]|nr:GIY-YIG nuclease family protein [Nitrospirota bacterium]MDP3598557.1 GIY-YIG nuclease family protein [Nitrospirota bacterium]
MTWIVYIVECSDGSLYTGITNDLARRVEEHGTGKGAKYTKHRGPVTVRYTERQDSKGAALTREAVIKVLRRGDKLALIAAQPPTEPCRTDPLMKTVR